MAQTENETFEQRRHKRPPSGAWDSFWKCANAAALERLFAREGSDYITLESLVEGFKQRERSFLRDVTVEEEGRVGINISRGAVITAEVVITALKKRHDKKVQSAAKKAQQQDDDWDVKEGKDALRRYAELADQRFLTRRRLRESRGLRIPIRKAKSRHNSKESVAL